MKQQGFQSRLTFAGLLLALGACDKPTAEAKSTSGQTMEPASSTAPSAATAKPKEAGCGNGQVDPGEACDGARIVKSGTAPADRQGCSADCKTTLADDACEHCQNEKCTKYQGVNLVSGCFDKLDTTYGAKAGDNEFVQDCTAVVNCALAHGCGMAGEGQGARCYCGSNSLEACASKGPADDAPCAREWLKAARAQNNDEMHVRFSDLVYPAGWAHALLDCYAGAEQCGASCSVK